MKSVVVYYFSGTGNTEIVASMIKEEFLKYEYHIDLIKIEDVLKNNLKIDFEKYDLIGIGAQVIGYGVPNIVYDFIRRLPKEYGKKVFIFRTAGGVVPKNYNSSKPMMRRLKKKGYNVFHERIFSIASNWVMQFSDNSVKQLYEATRKKVSIMCKEVMHGEKRIFKTSIGLKMIMEFTAFVSRWIFYLAGKDIAVGKSCTNCGLCIKNCPSRNIYEKNGKIKFKLSCNCCMRCIYACSQKAMNFKKLKFFTLAGGYNIKKTLGRPSSFNEEINGAIPPFLKNYVDDNNL